MTKTESDQLIQDIGEIKQALIESEYGPGLIKDHKDTKARTYSNQRAIARFKTMVYTAGLALTFIVTAVAFIKNWNSIF